MSDVNINLDQYDDDYDCETEPESGFPAGTHLVRIHQLSLEQSKKGDPMFKVELVVDDEGPLKNRRDWKYLVLPPKGDPKYKDRLNMLKQELFNIEYKGPISEFPQHFNEYTDAMIYVTVKADKDKQGQDTKYLNFKSLYAKSGTMSPNSADFNPPPPDDDAGTGASAADAFNPPPSTDEIPF